MLHRIAMKKKLAILLCPAAHRLHNKIGMQPFFTRVRGFSYMSTTVLSDKVKQSCTDSSGAVRSSSPGHTHKSLNMKTQT